MMTIMPKQKQIYLRRGRDYHVSDESTTDVHKQLPPGCFRLCYSSATDSWWFSQVDQFDIPEKLYGDLTRRANRIWTTYNDREKKGLNTGVLLAGAKGAGKTLLAKKVAADSGLPVVLINTAYSGDDFMEIIARLGRCIVIFDEFEKVYSDEREQNSVLTLFDGVYPTRALMFVIVNEASRLVDPLHNRPGRLFYSLDYNGLERSFIEEYAQDCLEDNSRARILGILAVSSIFESFNFDQLQALIEEMNRFNEPASEAVKFLNINPSWRTAYKEYIIGVFVEGIFVELPARKTKMRQHPVNCEHSIYFEWVHPDDIGKLDEDGDQIDEYIEIYITNNYLESVDPETDSFLFTFQEGRIEVVVYKNDDLSQEWSSRPGRRISAQKTKQVTEENARNVLQLFKKTSLQAHPEFGLDSLDNLDSEWPRPLETMKTAKVSGRRKKRK